MLAPAGEAGADATRWRTLAITLVAPFMAVFDVFVVNVALPSMQRTLHASFAELQFVVTSYTLAFAVMLVTGGRLGDIFGRKRVFEIGMLGFALTSVACGLAPSAPWLITARVLQGICSAWMSPQTLSMINVNFGPAERPRAFSIYGAVCGMSAVIALTLGGLLIRADLFGSSWRPIFLMNLPIAVVTIVLSRLFVHDSRSKDPPRLDPGGIVLVGVGLLLLVFPLVQGRDAAWPAWAFVCLATSVPTLLAFFYYERWKTQRDGSALVALGLFRERTFVAGLAVYLLSGLVTAALFFMLSFHLQLGLRMSPLATGLCVVPTSIGYFAGSVVSSKLGPRFGRGLVVICLVVRAVAAVATGVVVYVMGPSLTTAMIAPLLFVDGMSAAMSTVPITALTLRHVQPRDAGSGAGVFATSGQVASALGIAVIGVVFFGALAVRAPAVAARSASELRAKLSVTGERSQDVDHVIAEFVKCSTDRGTARDASTSPQSCHHVGSVDSASAVSRNDAVVRAALAETNARLYAFAYFLGSIMNALFIMFASLAARRLPAATVPVQQGRTR